MMNAILRLLIQYLKIFFKEKLKNIYNLLWSAHWSICLLLFAAWILSLKISRLYSFLWGALKLESTKFQQFQKARSSCAWWGRTRLIWYRSTGCSRRKKFRSFGNKFKIKKVGMMKLILCEIITMFDHYCLNT